VPIEGVVVEVDLAVQGNDAAVGGENERIDPSEASDSQNAGAALGAARP
jgi:hypothetical protein